MAHQVDEDTADRVCPPYQTITKRPESARMQAGLARGPCWTCPTPAGAVTRRPALIARSPRKVEGFSQQRELTLPAHTGHGLPRPPGVLRPLSTLAEQLVPAAPLSPFEPRTPSKRTPPWCRRWPRESPGRWAPAAAHASGKQSDPLVHPALIASPAEGLCEERPGLWRAREAVLQCAPGITRKQRLHASLILTTPSPLTSTAIGQSRGC